MVSEKSTESEEHMMRDYILVDENGSRHTYTTYGLLAALDFHYSMGPGVRVVAVYEADNAWVGPLPTTNDLYQFTVPQAYHCDGHTPGDTMTVRVKGSAGQEGWFTVENIHDGDQFPVQLSELKKVTS